MSAPKVIVIGILVSVGACVSSIYTPRLQRHLGWPNLRLLVWVVFLAQLLPLYACVGLLLPFGGLRTEAEMYVAAVWFGLVSERRPSDEEAKECSSLGHSIAIHELCTRSLSLR